MDYVKICGLKEPSHINLCKAHGATAVGFIYNVPNSPRNLGKKELKALLKTFPEGLSSVVVNRSEILANCIKIMNEIDADYYQFHCIFRLKELDMLPSEKRKKIIVGMKVNQTNKESIIKQIKLYSDHFFAFLLDNSEGHGKGLDYECILEVLEKTNGSKIIIAGGIKIDTLEPLIRDLKPFGIDASSSLESERGVKDPIKIVKFLDQIQEIKRKIGSKN